MKWVAREDLPVFFAKQTVTLQNNGQRNYKSNSRDCYNVLLCYETLISTGNSAKLAFSIILSYPL